ncbi:hypothetical protein FNAPI_13430 [Fusarium napiforme]|uniref:C2H2-type domain-containing protein n=1 Tax=Fusarium napiforme TaxID=42672 RepID=A0A8H5I5M9_9HYPO|nr:hypothetical protein FNAPI_13430 [Fusarium napiforme]
MEHRSLPGHPNHPIHSPVLKRYLYDTTSLCDRLFASSCTDRKKFYVDSHEPQLHTVREYVSRREPSQASQFPFLCVFHYKGCRQKFENKRDWKDHVVSQHLTSSRVFYECTEPSCTHTGCPRQQRSFANKHGFRTHLIQHHQPSNPHDTKNDITFLPDAEVQWLLDRQDSSMRMLCGLPENLGCPMPQCASVRFTGPTAWDQRLNHAAEHFLSSPRCVDVFGGKKDAELVQWASCNSAVVYQETPDDCLGQHDYDKSLTDSGYSSIHGVPQRRDRSQRGDSSSTVPSNVPLPGQMSDATFYDRGIEGLYLSAEPVGIGGWVQEGEFLEPILGGESNSSGSFQQPFSEHESIDDRETVGTSQVSGFSHESDGSPETAAVMQWFHGWLRQWLSSLTQERPSGYGNGNDSSQSTASQNQAGAGASTQKKQGAARPRRAPKRKKGKDDEDDDNGETPKSQRVDQGPRPRMLACPFYKRNPHKYGQRKWKSCAYPGYESMHRLK